MVSPVSIADASGADQPRTAARAIRIAYIDPQSYHGLAKYDLGYLRGLVDGGFDGEVLFYCSTLFDGRAPDGVALRPIFRYNRKPSRPRKALSYLSSMARLTLEAFSARAQLYHFQWFKLPIIDYFVVLVLRKVARVRVVMTAHNVVPHGEEGRPHRWLGRIYRAVDAIIVHNTEAASEIARRFSVDDSRFSVLRHGPIKIERRGKPRHGRQVRRFAARHDLRFLFVGRGSRYKGLDILLAAWPQVLETSPGKPGLMIIGAVDNELKQLAAHAAREHESLLLIDERVPEADLYRAMRCADVVVLPHRRISQSGVLLSALDRRVPVLVSSLPGLVEPLELGRIGWQFDGSVAGLAEQLRFLASHHEQVGEIRGHDAAWKAVEEAYAWRNAGCTAREVYRQLIFTS